MTIAIIEAERKIHAKFSQSSSCQAKVTAVTQSIIFQQSKRKMHAEHQSIFLGAKKSVSSPLQGRCKQRSAEFEHVTHLAKKIKINTFKKSSLHELAGHHHVEANAMAALQRLNDAQMHQMAIDHRLPLNPEPFLERLENVKGHSKDVIDTMNNLRHTLNEIHDNHDLDEIVEKANLFFAIKVLVNQLIQQTEEQTRDILRVIKERKKDIDALGDLMGAFTMAKGEVDYAKDPRMREIIDRARVLGIPIPENKYSFTQNERDDLYKAIEMKRQSIESFNQTTMVELQEKQSRYNSMFELATHMQKALHEIIKTILANLGRQ